MYFQEEQKGCITSILAPDSKSVGADEGDHLPAFANRGGELCSIKCASSRGPFPDTLAI